MSIENIIFFLAGMGLLMYGIKIMGEGLELAAGAKLKTLLEKMTSNRFLAVVVGFIITTLIQSSTATTVMVVGFVNTGIMNLTQAIGVIMGANIGTTTTSVLVSLNLSSFAPVAIAIGVMVLCKEECIQAYRRSYYRLWYAFPRNVSDENLYGAASGFTDIQRMAYECRQPCYRYFDRRRNGRLDSQLSRFHGYFTGACLTGTCTAEFRRVCNIRSEYRYLCDINDFLNRH